ncbi:Hypothetical_protein [Hexamita inflata]|uniref:Hypothetical_protein n=1 Tax=Hexamita inflata TaxID=28002 RepID=A0AA86UBQ4_9EUKA|nr:Hypothetical protein HINF_LOCUS33721 [Hexamita inflata]
MQFFSALASLVISFQLQKCLSQIFYQIGKNRHKILQNLTKNEPDMVKFSPDLPKNQENWGIPSNYKAQLGVYQNLPVVLPVTFAGKCQALTQCVNTLRCVAIGQIGDQNYCAQFTDIYSKKQQKQQINEIILIYMIKMK